MTWKQRKELENRKVISLGGKVWTFALILFKSNILSCALLSLEFWFVVGMGKGFTFGKINERENFHSAYYFHTLRALLSCTRSRFDNYLLQLKISYMIQLNPLASLSCKSYSG